MEICTSIVDYFQPPEPETVEESPTRTIPWDVMINDGHYVIYAELPGANLSDILVRVANENVIITCAACRRVPKSRLLVQELSSKPLLRSYALPNDAIPEKMSSLYVNGVLLVRIPRKPSFNVPVEDGKYCEIVLE